MAGLGHLGFGFAAKPLIPKVHIVVLLIASELTDILWGIFYFTGIDRGNIDGNTAPWSHSLFMSAMWALLAAIVAALIYRDRLSGLVIGLVVFSHWVVDFITHPMGAIFGGRPLPPDLPLFFNGYPKVGLGLYNHSFTLAIASDMLMLILGLVIYVWHRVKQAKRNKPKYRAHL
jgi:hypothetical protein